MKVREPIGAATARERRAVPYGTALRLWGAAFAGDLQAYQTARRSPAQRAPRRGSDWVFIFLHFYVAHPASLQYAQFQRLKGGIVKSGIVPGTRWFSYTRGIDGISPGWQYRGPGGKAFRGARS